MRQLEDYLRQVRYMVAQAIGEDASQPRVLLGERRASGLEHEMLSLPADTTSEPWIVNPDTGSPYFVVGASAIGEDDEVA